MCCGNIGFSSIMMTPFMGGGCSYGGWGMGMYSPSCFGWGFNSCCNIEKPFMTGLGVGVGYAGAALVVAGLPKLVNWIGGLFHKKHPETD